MYLTKCVSSGKMNVAGKAMCSDCKNPYMPLIGCWLVIKHVLSLKKRILNVRSSNWSGTAKLFGTYATQRELLIEAKLWIRPRPHNVWTISGPRRLPVVSAADGDFLLCSISLYYMCVCACVCPILSSLPSNQLIVRLTCLLACSHTCCLALSPPLVSAPHYTQLVRPTWLLPPSFGSVLTWLMTT